MEKPIEVLLNLGSEDPVPQVNESSLGTAHGSLTDQLDLPCDAVYSEPENDETDTEYQVEISRILPKEEHPVFGPYLGILCEATIQGEQDSIVIPLARITSVKNDENSKYVNVYNEWFWNFR